MTILRTIYIVLIAGIFGCKDPRKEKAVSGSPEDSTIHKIMLKELTGTPIELAKYKGKTIFINFWATWCMPCIEEMPSIEKAQTILQNEGVVFLLASGESVEEIDAFHNANDYKFNYILIGNSEELGIQALPTTFIFSPEGKLVFSESGFRKWDEKNNIEMIRKIAKMND